MEVRNLVGLWTKNIYSVYTLLNKQDHPTQIVHNSPRWKPNPKTRTFLFISSFQFLKNSTEESEFLNNRNAVIFDNPVRLMNFKKINILDCKRANSFTFQKKDIEMGVLLNFLEDKHKISIKVDKQEIIPHLLGEASNQYLWSLVEYTELLPLEEQIITYKNIADSIRNDGKMFNFEDTKGRLLNKTWGSISGKRFCKALSEVMDKKNKSKLLEISQKYKVNEHHLSYMIKFLRLHSKTKGFKPTTTTELFKSRQLKKINDEIKLNIGDTRG